MSQIKIKVDLVKSTNVSLGKNASKVSNVRSAVSCLKYDVNYKIKARRNIGSRITSARNTAAELEKKLGDLHSFINNSANKYCAADDYLKNLAPNVGLNAVASNPKFTKGDMGTIQDEITSLLDKLNVGVNAVVTNAKQTYSEIKKLIEPGGKYYKPFQIGKAVVRIGIGVVTVVGSVAAAAGTGGAATPMAAVTAVYGINDVVNGLSDLFNSVVGEYDNIGKFNYLKNSLSNAFGGIGWVLGNEEVGRLVGEGIYYVGNAATIIHGTCGAIKDIKKLISFKKADFFDEVKYLKHGIASTFDNAGRQLGNTRGIRKIKQGLNMDISSDIKKVKRIKDISKISAIQTLKNVDYWKTAKTTFKVTAIKPLRRFVRLNPQIMTIKGAVKGLRDISKLPSKIKGEIKDMKEDYNEITGGGGVNHNA